MTSPATRRRHPQPGLAARGRDRADVAERGSDIDVREIARRAEVGMGTLYRHFPTKEGAA